MSACVSVVLPAWFVYLTDIWKHSAVFILAQSTTEGESVEKQQTEGGFECMHIVLVCVALCMRVSVEEVVFTENLNSPFVFFSLPCVQLSFFSVSSHSSYRLSSTQPLLYSVTHVYSPLRNNRRSSPCRLSFLSNFTPLKQRRGTSLILSILFFWKYKREIWL